MTPDPIKTEPLAPVPVTIIGTGDGGVSLAGTVAKTPGDTQPNILINVVTPFVAILIRFLNVYIGSLAGILAGAMASEVIPAADFFQLFRICAGLALGGTVLLTLKDIGTVLTGMEKKFPLLTGSV